MKPDTQPTTLENISRQCADELANMISGNGWLAFPEALREEMAKRILRYLNISKENACQE